MLSVTPFLWFESQAEEAMQYYATVFPRTKTLSVQRMQGRVISVEFEIEGQRFMALNGNPQHKFNESVSFFVGCDTQAEIDALWDKLTAEGGAPNRCGWLKDKFGVSWQIIPKELGRLLSGGGDPARAQRVLQSMLQMQKIELSTLQAAFELAH